MKYSLLLFFSFTAIYNFNIHTNAAVYSSNADRVHSLLSALNEERNSKENSSLTFHKNFSLTLNNIGKKKSPPENKVILQKLIDDGFQFFTVHIVTKIGSPEPWKFLQQLKVEKNWSAFMSPNYTHAAISLQTLKKNKGRWTVLLFTPED